MRLQFCDSFFADKRRAFYLNEIGKLHLYQNEPDLAVPYFKESENSLHVTKMHSCDAISVQTLILCANGYDQGYV